MWEGGQQSCVLKDEALCMEAEGKTCQAKGVNG